MSVSLSSNPAADVDMRVSSKRGMVQVESEPSWVASFIERMDQRLDANGRRIEHPIDERLDANEHFRRNDVEQSRQFGDLSSDTSSTAGSSNSSAQAEWCPRTVLVRGWAPFGSPASQKIDRIEYKKVAKELLWLWCAAVRMGRL